MVKPKDVEKLPTLQELELAAEGATAVEQARRAAQIGTVKGAAKVIQTAKSVGRGLLPVTMAADLAQTAYTGFNQSADEMAERVEKNPYRGAFEGFTNPTTTLYSVGRAAASQADQLAAPFVDEFTKQQQERRNNARKFNKELNNNRRFLKELPNANDAKINAVADRLSGRQEVGNVVKQVAPSLEREPYTSEVDYFKQNPGTAGMATEDNRVIVNPYSNLSEIERKALIKNETSRVLMRNMPSNERPSFSITPEQRNTFKNYGSEQDIRETIAARILSGDPSAGAATKEQMAFASSLGKKMQSTKPEQYSVRPIESRSAKIDPYQTTRKLNLRP